MYDKLKTLSNKLIRQFGVECLIKTRTQGKYDPLTAEVSSSGFTEKKAHCLFDNLAYDFPSHQSMGVNSNSSSMIEQGDVIIYVAAEAEPELGSEIIVSDERWSVIKCQPIKPANTALIYQCQARKVV
ncbi:hypothetical protein A4G18_00440 [Pasteurellaceae bacterium Pebbles2]|nr:hypothetical protein [Pasteurellaceae bacterium Pebbles2]